MSEASEYTIGWVCAIVPEHVAAQAFLDEKHDRIRRKDANDSNDYTLGRIGDHNIVIAVLPQQYGLVNATAVLKDMVRTFSNLKVVLMVGIGGGVPTRHDIRLGDVVVSSVSHGTGGVIQYDFGKSIQGKTFEITGHLNQPPMAVQTAINGLRADHDLNGHGIEASVNGVLETNKRLRIKYQRPDALRDKLYQSSFIHTGSDSSTCNDCGYENLMARTERSEDEDNPAIHYGLIASANRLMKDASIRDRLSAEKDVLCFEMEAAGMMNHFPCLVIRGICDYSDSHKNADWQGYAAMTAAAYAKELLLRMTASRVATERTIEDILVQMGSTLQSVEAATMDVNHNVTQISSNMHDDAVSKWLARADPSTNYHKAREARHAGTGQWLLQCREYNAWKAKQHSFLWLSGDSGRGKTVLSSTVIQDLQDQGHPVLYFFFSFADNAKQSLEDLLRSLAIQLYFSRGEARSPLLSLHSSCNSGTQQPGLDALQRLFPQMLRDAADVYIVIDALDEYRGRSNRLELLNWIKDFRKEVHDVHLLVTSRPEDDIKSSIQVDTDNTIFLNTDRTGRDIAEYIHAEVATSKELARWQARPDVQEEIRSALLQKADGVFRWVACQLELLKDCRSAPQVREALVKLPKTLDDTYTLALHSLTEFDRKDAYRLLQFLEYSERPIRIEEAVDILAVDLTAGAIEPPRFDERNRMLKPIEISRICSTLIVVVTRKGSREEPDTVTELQLAHSSVKEYLTSRPEAQFSAAFVELTARAKIAEVCVVYLLGLEPMQRIRQLSDRYHLAQFAARYWAEHASQADGSSRVVHELAMQLLTKPTFRACYQIYAPDVPWQGMRAERNGYHALYYASYCGLRSCVHELIRRGSDVNAQGGEYGNALQAASSGGHLDIV